MERISVLEIFRTFTKSEIKKFSEFTHSPYFNKNSNVIKLFDIISKFAPKYDEEKLTKEFIWSQLYPGKNYNYGIISNLISELNKLAFRYLTIEYFESDPLERDAFLIGSFVYRGIANYASSKIQEVEKSYLNRDLSRTGGPLPAFYLDMWLISAHKHTMNTRLAFNDNISAVGKSSEEVTVNLSKLLLHALFVKENNFNRELRAGYAPENSFTKFFLEIFDDVTVSRIIERIKEISHIDYLLLKAFYLPISSKRKGATEKDYYELKDLIYSVIDLMNSVVQRELLTALNNLAIAVKNNNGFHKVNIYEERQKIFRNIIDRELHINAYGEADHYVLRIFCILGTELMDSETIRIVLDKYSNKVGKQLRKNFVKLCELTIAICEEDYVNALSLISTHTPFDQKEKINVRLLKAICLYELNYYELFLLEEDSFGKFSDYHANLEEHVLRLKKYYKYIGTLFRLREKFDITKFRKLYKEVFSDMSSHQWLKNTLNKMKEENGVKMKLLEMETDTLKKKVPE